MGEVPGVIDPLSAAAAAGRVRIRRFDEDFQAAKPLSDLPLEVDGFGALVKRATEAAEADGLLIDPQVIEDAVLGLLTGHLVLAGPPGTGKTSLVYALCKAFGVGEPTIETATADWSTYDVIGGHETARTADGAETIRPRLGIVPRAALRCAEAIAAHSGDGTLPQAHWIVIDEMNRCEMDKAFGPLFTILGNETIRSFPLWFEDDPKRAVVWIPRRLRIVGTLNSIDRQFVFGISQGLARRFQFVHVDIPKKEQREAESAAVYEQAKRWFERTITGTVPGADDPAVESALSLLMDFAAAARYGEMEWPLGTAQLVDVAKRLLLRRSDGATDLAADVDAGIAARIVPAMDQLPHDQIAAFVGLFATGGKLASLARTRQQIESLQRLSASF